MKGSERDFKKPKVAYVISLHAHEYICIKVHVFEVQNEIHS